MLLFSSSALGQDLGQARIEEELRRLSLAAGGTVGVAAVHIPSGEKVSLHSSQRFPMASTYKIAIAVALLRKVEAGELTLQERVELKETDLRPGSGTIASHLKHPGVVLPLSNLLELMLILSDNSATDLVLAKAGGPQAVTAALRELGVEEVRIDRPTLQLIADWAGVELPSQVIAADSFVQLFEAVTPSDRQKAAAAFAQDPRDTATPQGMVRLLMSIQAGEALNADHTALLLDIMRRCETGPGRIKGLLPPYAETAHKTGTIGGVTNDVGILTLPGQGGQIALAIFIRDSQLELPAREAAIAQMARAVYDYFLFAAPHEHRQEGDPATEQKPPR
ncbi:MAG TPA: class A beta-lactamase [Acidobacteriota bacterium]|nr:class A beta-lactamase [Acidobacteriota bacterium]